MVIKKIIFSITAAFLIILFPAKISGQISVKELNPALDSIISLLRDRAQVTYPIKIETLHIHKSDIEIDFNNALSEYPIRKGDLKAIYHYLRESFPERYKSYNIKVKSSNSTLEELYSKFYSSENAQTNFKNHNDPWVREISRQYYADKGLEGKNIALWPSHGYYYNQSEGRWKWQRAPFFSTIEDLFTQDFVVPYLTPMLENAGAYVVMPRERDYQKNEIIIDRGSPFYKENNGGKKYNILWKNVSGRGYGEMKEIHSSGENPFTNGDARMTNLSKKYPPRASYMPYFPESGKYGVYVSYKSLPKSTDAAEYRVIYSGGESKFIVNQQMGGGTWVYLGTFQFTKGENGQGVIVSGIINDKSSSNKILTTDAVRFGGGMGKIARNSLFSGVPKYAEAARYWLQWSGFPEHVYNSNNDRDDYSDDFQSRAKWVNSLISDFNVPIDLSLALHSDAGKSMTDSIIGTMAIYTKNNDNKLLYSNGEKRIIARELADIVQTEIVNDIRKYFNPDWSRRGLRDRSYFETRVPEVPALLIELLSHQNFSDMKLGLNPKFKFVVSRSIYKGLLKFLSFIYKFDYAVQPLPVTTFSATLKKGRETAVLLNWSHSAEDGEPTSKADYYIVYTRKHKPDGELSLSGFDNGMVVKGNSCEIPIKSGIIYSFKVVAVNRGGRSFPSEILSAGYVPDSKEVLVINNFNRVSAPETFGTKESILAGFNFHCDSGVPYIANHAFTGMQYNFLRDAEWVDDDNPGFGASYLDYGLDKVAGNSFDYPVVHGNALMKSGYSFSSSSMDALLKGCIKIDDYKILDIIDGKNEKEILPVSLHKRIENFCLNGGNIILSGAYIGKNIAPETSIAERERLKSLQNASEEILKAKNQLEALIEDNIKLQKASDSSNKILGYNYFETTLISDVNKKLKNKIKLLDSVENNTKNLSEELKNAIKMTDVKFQSEQFVKRVLKFGWSNGFASSKGKVMPVINRGNILNDETSDSLYYFYTYPNPEKYCVEYVDALLPADKEAFTFMRYRGSNTSAAVAYSDRNYKTVVFGFPLETITSQKQINKVLCEVLKFFSAEQ